jgi:DNA-binding NarL/FixJ family response regulator
VVADCKILIVDDFEEFRIFLQSALQKRPGFRTIWQAADGLEALQQAEVLQPDLILLDIGLPRLNGIEAARRIQKVSPNSKIIFVSQEFSEVVVEQTLLLGAHGYLWKSDTTRELVLAVDEVLQGRQFVSSSVRSRIIGKTRVVSPQKVERVYGHKVASYRDDASFVTDFARFIEAALKIGNPAIVIASEPHRKSLQEVLQRRNCDITAAIQEKRYIALDASEILSTFIVDGWPNADRVLRGVRDLLAEAAKATRSERPRVAACGEMGPMLLAQGNGEAAIELEHLTHEIADTSDVDILCGYMMRDVQRKENSDFFEKIRAEHSAAYSI